MGQLNNLDWEHTDIRALIDGCKGNAVVTGLAVSESSPAAMSVLVAAGTADVDDTDYVEGSGQNLNISNGHATLLRKDIVVYDTTAGAPAICEGTPAAAPHPPDVPADSIYLAMVHVGIAESTSITNSDIDEGRVYVNEKLRGIDTGATIDQTADEIKTLLDLTRGITPTNDGGFTTAGETSAGTLGNITDGSMTTFTTGGGWTTNTATAHDITKIDLGSVKTILEVLYIIEKYNQFSTYPIRVTIDVSADDSTWYEIVALPNQGDGVTAKHTGVGHPAIPIRYIRVDAYKSDGTSYNSSYRIGSIIAR